MSNSLNYVLTINKLIDGDNYATIQTQPNTNTFDVDDLGIYFNILSMNLKNSITNLEISSTIDLTINSIYEKIAFAESHGTYTDNTTESLTEFMNTLVGRLITVTVIAPNTTTDLAITKVVYSGYIRKKAFNTDVKTGNTFTLECRTLVSQLGLMSSNSSWDDTVKNFGNVFSTLGANQVNTLRLFFTLIANTLLNNVIFIDDGSFPKLPDNVYALIVPNKDRLSILREILIVYNRIIYQNDEGDIIVQPLYVNDRADTGYNIDTKTNANSRFNPNQVFNFRTCKYLSAKGVSNATDIVNRIDVVFAIPAVTSFNQSPYDGIQKSNIFASAPFIDKGTNTILANPADFGSANATLYTSVYKSSVRLYNSGKWVMPSQRPVSFDDAITDNILRNLFVGQFKYSSLWYSGNNALNTIPLFYAQLFLAEANVTNYNAEVVYDYLSVVHYDTPLAKVVTVQNLQEIDYPDNLCTETALSVVVGKGSTYTINTVPLLSITALWDTLKTSTA